MGRIWRHLGIWGKDFEDNVEEFGGVSRMDSGEDSEGRGGEFGMREGCGALRGAAGPRPHPDGVADDPGALRLRDDVAVAQHIAVHLPVRHHDQHFVGPRAALREHVRQHDADGGGGLRDAVALLHLINPPLQIPLRKAVEVGEVHVALHAGGELHHCEPGVGPTEAFDDFNDECLHPMEVKICNAARAVHQEHDVGGQRGASSWGGCLGAA